MKRVQLSELTSEYIYVTTKGPMDPTTALVSFAFCDPDDEPTTYYDGTWDGTATVHGSTYSATAKILVGPADTIVAVGRWAVWIKVDGTPEAPIRHVGYLTIV